MERESDTEYDIETAGDGDLPGLTLDESRAALKEYAEGTSYETELDLHGEIPEDPDGDDEDDSVTPDEIEAAGVDAEEEE